MRPSDGRSSCPAGPFGSARVRQGRADRAGERLRALRAGARVRTHGAAHEGDRAPEARDRHAPGTGTTSAHSNASRADARRPLRLHPVRSRRRPVPRGGRGPQAPPTMAELRRRGVRPVFLTNNSSRTPRQVADKLRAIGIEADPTRSSPPRSRPPSCSGGGGGRAFVIGQDGVREALTDAGIGSSRASRRRPTWSWSASMAAPRTLLRASLLVQRGARLVATNADGSYPAADGLWPGAGALLSVITTTTGAEPEIVGKPFTRCSRPVAGGEAAPARRRGPARHGHRGGRAPGVGHDARAHGRLGPGGRRAHGYPTHGDRGGRLRAARGP